MFQCQVRQQIVTFLYEHHSFHYQITNEFLFIYYYYYEKTVLNFDNFVGKGQRREGKAVSMERR